MCQKLRKIDKKSHFLETSKKCAHCDFPPAHDPARRNPGVCDKDEGGEGTCLQTTRKNCHTPVAAPLLQAPLGACPFPCPFLDLEYTPTSYAQSQSRHSEQAIATHFALPAFCGQRSDLQQALAIPNHIFLRRALFWASCKVRCVVCSPAGGGRPPWLLARICSAGGLVKGPKGSRPVD